MPLNWNRPIPVFNLSHHKPKLRLKQKLDHKKTSADVRELARRFGESRKDAFVLVLGPEGSGKTTIVKVLQRFRKHHNEIDVDDKLCTVRNPTVGFQVHHLKMVRHFFTIFDMSGKARYKSLWEEYYKQARALIYVFDCGDLRNLSGARDLLLEILHHPKMLARKTPLLILANKEDLADPRKIPDPDVYYDFLRLNQCLIRSRPHKLIFCSIFNCTAIRYGLIWMCEHVDVVTLKEPPCQCPSPYTDWNFSVDQTDWTPPVAINSVRLNYIAHLLE